MYFERMADIGEHCDPLLLRRDEGLLGLERARYSLLWNHGVISPISAQSRGASAEQDVGADFDLFCHFQKSWASDYNTDDISLLRTDVAF